MAQRLIDADAVEKVLKEKHFNRVLDSDRWVIADIKKGIMDLPTVDAVPVIRCKDCKYWNPKNKYCEGIGNWFGIVGEWGENGFCYKAERRGEE